MAFTFQKSKDWAKNIDDFMKDYNVFSNGYENTNSGKNNVARWGSKAYGTDQMVAL